MNKNLKAGLITFSIIGVILLAVYLYNRRKNKVATNKDPVLGGTLDKPIEKPASNTQIGVPLEVATGLGAQLIDRRAREIYQNKTALENVIQQRGVPVPDTAGTKFPAGIARVLNDTGFQSFPVVPSFISPAYKAEINNFITQPDFENLAKANIDSAKSTYRNALNFVSVRFFPWEALDKAVQEESFGKPSKTDKNKSERYNAAIIDLKTVYNRVLESNKKLTMRYTLNSKLSFTDNLKIFIDKVKTKTNYEIILDNNINYENIINNKSEDNSDDGLDDGLDDEY
jgi:hypothetical protein